MLGKGAKRRQIPISAELVNSRPDEHLLTEYPVLGRLPVPTDHLWFPVHKVGDRIIKLVPEKVLVLLQLLGAWWKKVEDGGGRPPPQAAHDAAHVRDRRPRRHRGRPVRGARSSSGTPRPR